MESQRVVVLKAYMKRISGKTGAAFSTPSNGIAAMVEFERDIQTG
jgi:hypothetical protein